MYKKILLAVTIIGFSLYQESKADIPKNCSMIKRYYQSHSCEYCRADLPSWVQAAVHALIGSHNLTATERKQYADDITNKIVRWYGSSVNQDDVEKVILDELTEKTVIKVREYCTANKVDYMTTEKIASEIKTDIRDYIKTNASTYYKFGVPDNTFATYYNPGSLVYKVESKIKSVRSRKTDDQVAGESFAVLVGTLFDAFFGNNSTTNTNNNRPAPQQATAPKKDTVKPSAPTLEQINGKQEPEVNENWARDEKQCSICLEDYDKGDHKMSPFKCGHAICKTCRNIKGANQIKLCPICRATI